MPRGARLLALALGALISSFAPAVRADVPAPPADKAGDKSPDKSPDKSIDKSVDKPTADLLDRVEKSARGVETIAGEFVQKNRLKLFKQELKSKGRFYFQRPRRIRWEYLDPDPSVLVLDGDKATLRSPGAAPQVFDLAKDATMRAVFDQLLLWLGSGAMSGASRDYQITTASGAADAPSLVLAPRAASPVSRAFRRIELRFDKALILRGILLCEAAGDEKEISFTRVDRNGKLPADAFR